MITSLINFDVDERREVHVSMLTRDMYITLTISLSITNREHFGRSTLVATEVSIIRVETEKKCTREMAYIDLRRESTCRCHGRPEHRGRKATFHLQFST
jgi:hypothetical protein